MDEFACTASFSERFPTIDSDEEDGGETCVAAAAAIFNDAISSSLALDPSRERRLELSNLSILALQSIQQIL